MEIILIMAMNHLACYRVGFAGDIVATTSTLRGIKKKHPESRLTYIVWKHFAELLALCPWIDELAFPGFYMPSSFDVMVDLRHDMDMPRFIGDDDPLEYWGKVHAMQARDKGLLDEMDSYKPELYIGPDDVAEKEDNSKICAINVFSANGINWRLWSFDKWIELISNLKKMGYKTVQLGGDDDPRIEGVDVQLCGKTRLAQVVGVLAVSSLFVGIDSFAHHVACSRKYVHNVEDGAIEKIGDSTPSVLICGPVPWKCVTPPDAKCIPVYDYPDCEGPCNHSFPAPGLEICCHDNTCMRKLSVQKVLEGVEKARCLSD